MTLICAIHPLISAFSLILFWKLLCNPMWEWHNFREFCSFRLNCVWIFTAKPLSFAYIAQQTYAILYFLPNVEYHYCDIWEKLTETKAVYLHVFGDDAVLTKMWHNCTVTIQLMQYIRGQTIWITSISRWLRFLVNLTGK